MKFALSLSCWAVIQSVFPLTHVLLKSIRFAWKSAYEDWECACFVSVQACVVRAKMVFWNSQCLSKKQRSKMGAGPVMDKWFASCWTERPSGKWAALSVTDFGFGPDCIVLHIQIPPPQNDNVGIFISHPKKTTTSIVDHFKGVHSPPHPTFSVSCWCP